MPLDGLERAFATGAPDLKFDADGPGTIKGYGAVFGVVDQGGDVLDPKAFDKMSPRKGSIKMLWQHDPTQPIGVWDEVREDERGLWVKGRLLESTVRARRTLSSLRAAALLAV